MIALVKIGSDIDAVNLNLDTPLNVAVLYGKLRNLKRPLCFYLKMCGFLGRSEIAALLVGRHAKVDLRNSEWNTPLHHAAKYGNILKIQRKNDPQ